MRGHALTTPEIKAQIARGRNYERLYRELKPKYDAALKRIDELEQYIRDRDQYWQRIVEAQAARIEQLETMVFGRKSKFPKQPKLRLTAKRDNVAYHRPLPPASAITTTETLRLKRCNRCGHALTNKITVVRYEEDIVLPAFEPRLKSKKVTRQLVERGWCSSCGQWSSAKDMRGETVTLGPVVRSYIVYLVCHLDLSYAQVTDLLLSQHGLVVSGGEITAMLDQQRNRYLPTYHQLLASVRAGPLHMDETGYPIQSEHGTGNAWVATKSSGNEVVFRLAGSRSRAHAEALLGDGFTGVGITDRYPAYKHVFVPRKHQICWAHLSRNAKSIAALECLDEPTRQRALAFYRDLSQLYTTIRQVWVEPFDVRKRRAAVQVLLPQVTALCQPDDADPKQLADLKRGILEYQNSLFVCLTEKNVPPDNNKAERALRKLVLKRKKSFGVKTAKGARTMEVLYSVVQSLANQDKTSLLPRLYRLATA
jgi:transposase